MILQQKMVKEAAFSSLSLSLRTPYLHSLLKYSNKSEQSITVRAQIMAGNSYDFTSAPLLSRTITGQAHFLCQFSKQLSILLEEGQNFIELSISFYSQQSRISTSNTQINLSPKFVNTGLELEIADASSEPIGTMAFKCEIKPKVDLPYISIKNITCELRNSINAPQVSRFLEIVVGRWRFRNRAIITPIYWEEPFKFYIEEGSTITWGLVESESCQRIPIPVESVDSFNLLEGFRRVFITEAMEMPRGCIQFYYQSRGLRSQEEYRRQAEQEENYQRQILKLTVKTIKGKLKSPHSNLSVRLFSGINFLKTDQTTDESSELVFTVNRYLYLESREARCNLIVYSNEEVLGFGALQLNIVGFFERRVGIVSPVTKKELGYLMVGVQSEKHAANSIQLAQLRLNLGEQQLDRPSCFLSFAIKGCCTRTELQHIDGCAVSFRRFILMKYTKEEELEVALIDSNNQELLKTVVRIEDLKSCGDPVLCRKVLAIRPEVGCTLELTCIYGDLNKININQELAKKAKEAHLAEKKQEEKQVKKQEKVSLVEQKRGKQAHAKKYGSSIAEEFREFEESLANHIKTNGNPEKKRSKISLWKKDKPTKGKSVAHSEKQQTYRVIYTSRPLNPYEYSHSHQKSEGKQPMQIELPQLKIKGKANENPHSKLAFPKMKDILLDSYKLQQISSLPRR